MKLPTLAALLVAVCPCFVGAAEVALRLVTEGQPRAAIVMSASLKYYDFSAKTLISHVQQMSGATLPVIKESEFSAARIEKGRVVPPNGKTTTETFILLGESELTRGLGLSTDELGPGGILVATKGNAIA